MTTKRSPRPVSTNKTKTCLGLLGRKRGATLAELMTATGWQTSDSDCDETAGKIETTTKRMRWNGTAVEATASTETTEVDPADCAEP